MSDGKTGEGPVLVGLGQQVNLQPNMPTIQWQGQRPTGKLRWWRDGYGGVDLQQEWIVSSNTGCVVEWRDVPVERTP